MRRNGSPIKKILISLLVVIYLFLSSANLFADILIIANKSVFESSIPVEDLRDIFLGKKKKWASHMNVNVSINQSEDAFDMFTSRYLKRTPKKFLRHWKGMLFTGEAQYPRIFSNSQSVLSYVSKKEGAIGYINASALDDSVKVIKIVE